MQIETLQCLPSFVTLRAKSLPRPTKPAGTLLRTQAGASTFQGPVFTSPQLHHQLPPLTCHQMRRLQVTEICTTGVYSPLIEHALVLQRPRISCPEVCKPASRAAIYSSIWSTSLRTGFAAAVHTLDPRGNQEAGVGRGECGAWTKWSGMSTYRYNLSQYRMELKVGSKGGRPGNRGPAYSPTWNHESKDFTFKPGLLGVIKVKEGRENIFYLRVC